MELQICIKCKIEKPKTEFHKRREVPRGTVSSCKLCKREISKIDYHQRGGKEKSLIYLKKYREKR